jgi:hypothetical protein
VIFSIEPQHLVWLGFLGLGLLGAAGGVGRWLLTQSQQRLDHRFESLERTLNRESDGIRELRLQLSQVSQMLPVEYVRREDWIRFSTVIDAKIDRLGDRISDLTRAQLARMQRPGDEQ